MELDGSQSTSVKEIVFFLRSSRKESRRSFAPKFFKISEKMSQEITFAIQKQRKKKKNWILCTWHMTHDKWLIHVFVICMNVTLEFMSNIIFVIYLVSRCDVLCCAVVIWIPKRRKNVDLNKFMRYQYPIRLHNNRMKCGRTTKCIYIN